MRFLLIAALLLAFVGCEAEKAPASKEQAAPKVQSGRQASGVGIQEQGH